MADAEDDFRCGVCLDLLNDAVNTTCCHQLYCRECIERCRTFYNYCPNCKSAEWTILDNIPVKRHTAEMRRKRDEIHPCPAPSCPFKGKREEFLNHLVNVHAEVTARNAEKLFVKPLNLENVNGVRNELGRPCFLGEYGKYFCGVYMDKNQQYMCGWREGFNCHGCMKLDILQRDLPKGSLINDVGAPSVRSRLNGRFYCARRCLPEDCGAANQSPQCGPLVGEHCHSCRRLQKYEPYYQRFL